MTAGDVPVTTRNSDQGFEGYRFVGYSLYDGLLLWDLSRSDKPSDNLGDIITRLQDLSSIVKYRTHGKPTFSSWLAGRHVG